MHEEEQERSAKRPPDGRRLHPQHFGILEAEIPLGGKGRKLSAGECRKLRERGVTCDERYVVVRVAVDTPRLGHLYAPIYTAEVLASVGVTLG